MELVDVYNERHEKLNYTKEKKKLEQGEYRLSCFVWIINNNGEMLIQQRLASAKKCPNMWETASGGAINGETGIDGALRELKEELGLKIEKEELKYIGTFTRTNDFVEVFMLKKNISISNLKLQEEEVQAAKWIKIKDFEKLIDEDKACDTSYNIFKEYYEKYYNKYVVFIDGKPVLKEIENV